MGAWNTGVFDNDNAADFALELEHCADNQARTALLMYALGVLIEHDYKARPLDLDYEFPYEIEDGIAAAAYVADTLNGRRDFTDTAFAMGYDKATDDYGPLSFDPVSPELLTRAQEALRRLLQEMESAGIQEEWRETSKAVLAALGS